MSETSQSSETCARFTIDPLRSVQVHRSRNDDDESGRDYRKSMSTFKWSYGPEKGGTEQNKTEEKRIK